MLGPLPYVGLFRKIKLVHFLQFGYQQGTTCKNDILLSCQPLPLFHQLSDNVLPN